ncbi:MAG TPA: NADH-quinone oxidoreductase subunit C [Candidatus Bathyarchaeia archaeon]|nr:NADH-quinone oxidoreductase subunit C [Candidatus Bathyarchaeia archaeon]
MMRPLENAVQVIESSHKGLNSYYHVALDDLDATLAFLGQEGARLATITGKDARDHLEVLYHFAISAELHTVIVDLPYDTPNVPTITNHFIAALLYERELIGLLGINVIGIPDSRPLELPPKYGDPTPPLRRV